MVGQSLGAKKYDRVPKIMKVVLYSSVLISTVLAVALFFFSEPIFKMFTGDEEVLAIASIVVLPAILNMYGSGNAKLNFAIAIIDGVISRIGILALLGFAVGMGCQGFWYGDALAGYMPIVIGLIFFFSGR